MPFPHPALPYAIDSLAPHLTKEALDFHWGKHHKAYVDNLNKAVAGTPRERKTLEQLIQTEGAGPIYNNAAQVWNHTFYWNSMKPGGGGDPTGPLLQAIKSAFGDVAKFKDAF
ncbi:MAG: superoxide dismutase [Fe], partial [Planctomycetales bacterium]|nr:superoxide dismutase [Fe] [Planctomycetales bacterium]